MQRKRKYIELCLRSASGEQRLVRRAGERIRLGSAADNDVVLPDHALNGGRITLRWRNDDELFVERASNGGNNPAIRVGESVTFGDASITWRWLPPEEWPTMPGPPAAPANGVPAAAEIAAEFGGSRYERGREVGRGGMGRVLEALEKPLRRPVALKVLLRGETDEDQKRFIREARITGRLEHPSIVPVHELNVDESGRVFYTMKLVKGVTLLQVLQELAQRKPEALRRYNLASLLTVFQKVCDAVAFAHAQPDPIIHRDLKPENIMLGDYGEVLVMDWGAAKLLQRAGEIGASEECHTLQSVENDALCREEAELDVLVTQPGSTMGTPGYMAPEQVRGHAAAADERTDIYALGAILYSILTLEAPARITAEQAQQFSHRLETDQRSKRDFQTAVAPLLLEPSRAARFDHLPGRVVPDSLAAVALKTMAFHPQDRFASVKELQADVAAYQTGFATSAEAARPWRRFKLLVRRNKILFASLAAIFVILLAATAISLHQRQAALASNKALERTLQQASLAEHETARQRFASGAWREGIALMARALTFWPENREAANYLLSAIKFGRGDRESLPNFGVYHGAPVAEAIFSPDGQHILTASYDGTTRRWDSATGREIGGPMRHGGPCGKPCMSPDGRQLVTTGADGLVMLWDVQTGARIAEPMRHGRPDLDPLSDVLNCIFSQDGKRILTSSLDHTARLWDTASGHEIAQLVNPHRVAEAVFSPDGSRILTSYWYGGAMLWDAQTFQPTGAPLTHSATVRRAVFSPDGTRIVTSSLDNTARIWDGHTAAPLTLPISHPDMVWNGVVSPDGKLLATACYDKAVRLWSITDGIPVGVPMEHEGPVSTIEFSPDGTRLLSASRDKTVRLWDTQTCKPVGTPMRHDEAVLGALFDPDGTKILSFGWDNAAYVWHAEPLSWPGEVIPIPGEVRAIEFDQDEDRIFAATKNSQAGLWSLSQRRFVTPPAMQTGEIIAAAFHSASGQFATVDDERVIRFWDARRGAETGRTPAGQDTVVGLSYSADGRSLFAAYLNGSAMRWKVPEGTLLGEVMKHSEKMDALAVAPHGREIATGCRDDFLHFWDAESGTRLPRTIRHGNPVLAISYSPDGKFIATGCADHTARIWSLQLGKQVGEPIPIDGRADAVRFTAHGNALLVGGSDDTTVDYYDTRTHRSLYHPLPHATGVRHIAASADGTRVITVANDGVARFWHMPFTSEPPPKWFPDYLRAVGGLTFSSGQQLVPVSTRERLELRAKLLGLPSDGSVWHEVMRQSLTTPSPPAATP